MLPVLSELRVVVPCIEIDVLGSKFPSSPIQIGIEHSECSGGEMAIWKHLIQIAPRP
jgi:hypothetical protein